MTIKLSDFDVVDYLVDSKTMAYYLTDALEEGGVPLFLKACGDVARARGMTEVAADAGLTRASLYKALGEDGNPSMATVSRVLDSLGFKMVIRPSGRKEARAVTGQRRRADARVMRTEAPVARTRVAQDRVPYAARKAPAKKAKGQGAASKRKR